MILDKEKLDKIRELRDPAPAMRRIDYHYCRRLQDLGLCTTQCDIECREYLDRITQPAVDAKDRYAILVWRCREEAAKFIENSRPTITLHRNKIGETIERNPFDELTKHYES